MNLVPLRVLVVAAALVGVSACGGEDTCEKFNVDLESCYDAHCSTSTSAFCGCWNSGKQDISLGSCSCIARASDDQICYSFDLDEYAQNGLDCSAASAAVDDICTTSPVQ